MGERQYSSWLLERIVVGDVIRLRKGLSTVGRSPSSTIRITDSNFVSRNHAEITVSDASLDIKDLNSINGIFVNDTLHRQENVQLNAGDRIGIGVLVTNDDAIDLMHPIYIVRHVPLRDVAVRPNVVEDLPSAPINNNIQVPVLKPSDSRSAVEVKGRQSNDDGPSTSRSSGRSVHVIDGASTCGSSSTVVEPISTDKHTASCRTGVAIHAPIVDSVKKEIVTSLSNDVRDIFGEADEVITDMVKTINPRVYNHLSGQPINSVPTAVNPLVHGDCIEISSDDEDDDAIESHADQPAASPEKEYAAVNRVGESSPSIFEGSPDSCKSTKEDDASALNKYTEKQDAVTDRIVGALEVEQEGLVAEPPNDDDDLFFSQLILDDMKADMFLNDVNDMADELLPNEEATPNVLIKVEPDEGPPAIANCLGQVGPEHQKIENSVPWIISDDEDYDEELEAKVSGWSTKLFSQSLSQSINMSQVYDLSMLTDSESEDEQADSGLVKHREATNAEDAVHSIELDNDEAESDGLYNRNEDAGRIADEMFEDVWLKIRGCQSSSSTSKDNQLTAFGETLRESKDESDGYGDSPLIRNRGKRKHAKIPTSSEDEASEAEKDSAGLARGRSNKHARIIRPPQSSDKKSVEHKKNKQQQPPGQVSAAKIVKPNRLSPPTAKSTEMKTNDREAATVSAVKATERTNHAPIVAEMDLPIQEKSPEKPQRAPPAIIDAPQMPRHKGKLRGISATTGGSPSMSKQLTNKSNSIRQNARNEMFQEELRRKWMERPSHMKAKQKEKMKALKESRKERLKELAGKQQSECNQTKTQLKEVIDDGMVKKRAKVKVTSENRGAFLTKETIERPKKSYKIPKVLQKDKPNSDTSKTSNKQIRENGNDNEPQIKITTPFEIEIAKADELLIKRMKGTPGEAAVCKDALKARAQRTTNKITFASMQKNFEETNHNQRMLKRLNSTHSCLTNLATRDADESRKKKTVRFNETPVVHYIERVVGTRRLVDVKEILPRSVISDRRQATRRAYPVIDHTQEIISQILQWGNEWLLTRNAKANEAANMTTFPMPPKFQSFEQYKSIIFPLMKLEFQTRLDRDYKSNSKLILTRVALENVVTQKERLILVTKLSKCSSGPKWNPNINFDLVLLDFGTKSKLPTTFAYLSSSRKRADSSMNRYVFEILGNNQLREFLQHHVKEFYVHPVVDNVRVEFGSFNAVHQLQSTPLFQKILEPVELLACKPPPKKKISYKGFDKLNETQHNILLNTYCKVIDENMPSITLMQGPPGTGKSRMIANLALQTLYGEEVRMLDKKILICAQSNMAVDILAERFQFISHRMRPEHRFDVIRYGQQEKIHPKVLPISLQKRVELDQIRKLLTRHPNIETINRESLEPQMKTLESEIADLEARNIEGTVLEHELLEKQKHLKLLRNIATQSMPPEDERSVFKWYLEHANIVCTTLSSCVKLSSYVDYFDICIIDEATQSTEPWTLVPLKFGIHGLVLVGDNQQLPATVLSKKAADLGLGASLFTRIQRHLEAERPAPPTLKLVVCALDTQYRMHPEICKWPNSYFYNNSLLSAPITLKYTSRIVPFSILQLSSCAQDNNCDNGQIVNNLEAQFVAKLIKALDGFVPTKYNSYGVITPYAQQRNALSAAIKVCGISNVMVNTIDSYQGSEKDVIVISNARTAGIGFLSNYQRLNVALTRAKKCLILCGNFSNLESVPAWRSLLKSARERQLYHEITATPNVDIQAIIEKIKVKKKSDIK